MPALVQSEYAGEVVWMGVVPEGAGLQSSGVHTAEMDFAGAPGEKHAGLTRPSCSRFTMLYPKGTTVRNTRQLSILSDEELNAIAAEMGMARLAPEYLGASLVVKGIPDFTHVPPSSRLVAPSGLVLTVDLENGPCHLPGKEIEADHPGFGAAFKPAAQDRRGVTAWVERPGALSVGEMLTLFLPTQRGWRP